MRLSDGQRYSFLLRTMSELQARQNTAMQEASTGLRIGKPSDDAPAAASSLRLEGTIQKIKSYQTVISRTSSDAQLAEGIIAESHTLFQRARELTVQASNESLSASDRIAIAGEIDGLREQLISLSNTKGSQGSLFSGSQLNSPAFDSSGVYQGDNYQHKIEIAPGVDVTANLSGDTVFGPGGGQDTFATLANLSIALNTNNTTAIAASLDGIDGSLRQLSNARSNAGLLVTRFQSTEAAHTTTLSSLVEQNSKLTDVDAYDAITRLQKAGSSIDNALSVARTVLSVNLNRFS